MRTTFKNQLRAILLGGVFGASLLLLNSVALPTAWSAPVTPAMDNVDLKDISIGSQIKVTLAGGRVLEGELTQKGDFSIKLRHKFGVAEIKKGEILGIELYRSTAELFEERAADCQSADDWFELGEWAKQEQEDSLAQRAFREAIGLDPNHAQAREELGHVQHEGEWMPLAEAMEKQGKEFYRGEWRTPEEIAELDRQEAEEQQAEKLKGRKELEVEYQGRPWALIEPIETPHYIVWCNSTQELAEFYADVMEALYKKYDQVFPEKYFPRNSRKKSEVFIHANHQQFMDWTFNGPGTGGFYRPATRDVTAYHGSFGTTGSTLEVLAHEGTHQFQGLIFDNFWALPAWFFEGMAVYFGDGSKISRRKVEINEIPRDRLLGLQEAMKNGTYCDMRQLLRTIHPRFTGFHYGHAWGLIFWCLWGEKMGANNKGVGRPLMEEWFVHCVERSKKPEACNYEVEAKKFEEILTRHTGKSLDDWEAEYKEWILGLEVEPLGKKRGNNWSSEALKLYVQKPVGWQWVKEAELASDEVVAAKGQGRTQKRRVMTYCWPNWQKATMTVEYASRLSNNIFQQITDPSDYVVGNVGGYPGAIRATFKAKRVLKSESSGDENGQPIANTEVGDELKYEVVFYGSLDKIYCNVFECDPAIWDSNYKHFEKYLQDFRIDN